MATNKTQRHRTTIGVMAPLMIGDPSNLTCDFSLKAWAEFEGWLATLAGKSRKPDYVSVDVWMGHVNPEENVFQFGYYRHLFEVIINHGFKILPIMSFHQCGGNIGDTVYQAVPQWLWKVMAAAIPSGDVNDLKFVSEYGNASIEYPSPWAIEYAVPYFSKMMVKFQEEFADLKDEIVEVNVSCGPAGELRSPAYNSHDANDKNHAENNVAGYPHRGTLQMYSNMAKACFRAWVLKKYGTLEEVAKAWGRDVATLPAMIIPPADTERFFGNNEAKNTQYGRDVFDFYHESLLENTGRKVIGAAIAVFGAEDAAFCGIPIGFKVPGVHWGMGVWEKGAIKFGNRFPELTAGLIRTSDDWSPETGAGYGSIISLFKGLQATSPRSPLVVHFTCLEMGDGREGPDKQSLAHSLVCWFGEEAKRQGVLVKGENALNFTLADSSAWELIRSVLKPADGSPKPKGWKGLYSGLTILRVSDVQEGVAASELAKTLEFVGSPVNASVSELKEAS